MIECSPKDQLPLCKGRDDKCAPSGYRASPMHSGSDWPSLRGAFVLFLRQPDPCPYRGAFGVKPAASARDPDRAYRALAPNNLQYNAALRCYRPTAAFQPVFEHTPAHVLSWFRSGAGDGLEGASAQIIPCEAAQDLVQPNLSMLATITRAITAGEMVEVSYLSLTSGASANPVGPAGVGRHRVPLAPPCV